MLESRINSGLEPVTGQMISCDFAVTTVTAVKKTLSDTVIRFFRTDNGALISYRIVTLPFVVPVNSASSERLTVTELISSAVMLSL